MFLLNFGKKCPWTPKNLQMMILEGHCVEPDPQKLDRDVAVRRKAVERRKHGRPRRRCWRGTLSLSLCLSVSVSISFSYSVRCRVPYERLRVCQLNKYRQLMAKRALEACEGWTRSRRINPSFQPFTLHPSPCTLNPEPSTLQPEPRTPNPEPQTLNPQPSTLNPQPSTLNHKPSTHNPQTSTLNPKD